MKLLDVLSQEMKTWPADEITALGQNKDGRLYVFSKQERSFGVYIFTTIYSISEDAGHAGVTRSQWQAAVDALKAGEQEWDGEWKPPVGTVCEVPDGPDYREATIIAYYKDMAVFAFDDEDGHPYVETCLPLECRRIRTAEQIAEQAHREAVEELAAATNWILTREACELVLEAGYRKQEVQQ